MFLHYYYYYYYYYYCYYYYYIYAQIMPPFFMSRWLLLCLFPKINTSQYLSTSIIKTVLGWLNVIFLNIRHILTFLLELLLLNFCSTFTLSMSPIRRIVFCSWPPQELSSSLFLEASSLSRYL